MMMEGEKGGGRIVEQKKRITNLSTLYVWSVWLLACVRSVCDGSRK